MRFFLLIFVSLLLQFLEGSIKSSMQVKTISYKDAKPIIQFLKTINCSYIVIQLNNFTLIFKKKKKTPKKPWKPVLFSCVYPLRPGAAFKHIFFI